MNKSNSSLGWLMTCICMCCLCLFLGTKISPDTDCSDCPQNMTEAAYVAPVFNPSNPEMVEWLEDNVCIERCGDTCTLYLGSPSDTSTRSITCPIDTTSCNLTSSNCTCYCPPRE